MKQGMVEVSSLQAEIYQDLRRTLLLSQKQEPDTNHCRGSRKASRSFHSRSVYFNGIDGPIDLKAHTSTRERYLALTVLSAFS